MNLNTVNRVNCNVLSRAEDIHTLWKVLTRLDELKDSLMAVLNTVEARFQFQYRGCQWDKQSILDDIVKRYPTIFMSVVDTNGGDWFEFHIGDILVSYKIILNSNLTYQINYKEVSHIKNFLKFSDLWTTPFTVDDIRGKEKDLDLYLQWLYVSEIMDVYFDIREFNIGGGMLTLGDVEGKSRKELETMIIDYMRESRNEIDEFFNNP